MSCYNFEKVDYLALIKLIGERDNVSSLAELSSFNHHANGLHYLCLERNDHRTVKLYFVPEVVNPNNGFLVNPHNHRYDFMSTVLYGRLKHYRFRLKPGFGCVEYDYQWETKAISPVRQCNLEWHVCEHHEKGDRYFTSTKEIHTLKIVEPTIIGITQLPDTNDEARLYVPKDGDLEMPRTRSMSSEEYKMLLRTVWAYLDRPLYSPRLCGFES